MRSSADRWACAEGLGSGAKKPAPAPGSLAHAGTSGLDRVCHATLTKLCATLHGTQRGASRPLRQASIAQGMAHRDVDCATTPASAAEGSVPRTGAHWQSPHPTTTLRQFVVVQNHFPLLPRSVWRAPGVSRPALRARQRRADASPRAQGSPFLCALSLRVAAKSLMTRWRARRPVQERLVPSGARLGRGDRSAHESAGETDRPDKAMARR